jgi:hypothetical protein
LGANIYLFKIIFQALGKFVIRMQGGEGGGRGEGVEFGTQDIKYSPHEVTGGTELPVEQELQK